MTRFQVNYKRSEDNASGKEFIEAKDISAAIIIANEHVAGMTDPRYSFPWAVSKIEEVDSSSNRSRETRE